MSLAVTSPRRRTSVLAVVTMLVLCVLALAIAALTVITGGPVEVLVSALAAAISCPLIVLLCFWLDRYEPEPGRYRIAALLWGATGAAVIGVGLSLLLIRFVDSSNEVAAVVWAPVSEELGKGLFLAALVLLRRQQLHGVLDGIVYAALIGVGFAFIENVLYYREAFGDGGLQTLTVLFVLRGVIGPFAHPLFTSMIGIGVGIAVTTRSPLVRVAAPALGYLGAVGLHAIWNGSVTFYSALGFLAAYVVIMIPALGVVSALAVWVRKREGAMIGSGLAQCVPYGWVRQAEIDWVARMPARMAARRYARQSGGPDAGRAMRAYQQTLTEMAFLHLRVVEGSGPADAEQRMSEIVARAAALRPYVTFPPEPASYSPIPGPP